MFLLQILQGVLDGVVQFGIVPCDEILVEHLAEDRALCVATICHTDISAVAVLETSAISSPEMLVGAKYGSCGYPLEVSLHADLRLLARACVYSRVLFLVILLWPAGFVCSKEQNHLFVYLSLSPRVPAMRTNGLGGGTV